MTGLVLDSRKMWKLLFFWHEFLLTLSINVNMQHNKCWSCDSLCAESEIPFCDPEVRVWCAASVFQMNMTFLNVVFE
jgi:hypothetical protein